MTSMTKTALKPDFFFSKLPSFRKNDEEAAKKGATEEERQLYAMSQLKGWEILNNFIDRISDELDSINKEAIAGGASLEEIGQNAVVINIAQDFIERIKNKVSDAVEACETPEDEQ